MQETQLTTEAISLQQRRERGRRLKRIKGRLSIGRAKANRRFADTSVLKRRSKKAARTAIFKKLSKGKKPSELSPQRRMEIEKRLDKMKNRIALISIKTLPKVRKLEMDRKSKKKGNKNK